MRAHVQLLIYCSSQDGLLHEKRLSTGVGDNRASFLLDQDLEAARCVSSAKKQSRPPLCYSSSAEYCSMFFPWIFRYFCFFLSSLFSSCLTPWAPLQLSWCPLQGVQGSCWACTLGWVKKAKHRVLVYTAAKGSELCLDRVGYTTNCSKEWHLLGMALWCIVFWTKNQMLLSYCISAAFPGPRNTARSEHENTFFYLSLSFFFLP